jgi:hypothetical protein
MESDVLVIFLDDAAPNFITVIASIIMRSHTVYFCTDMMRSDAIAFSDVTPDHQGKARKKWGIMHLFTTWKPPTRLRIHTVYLNKPIWKSTYHSSLTQTVMERALRESLGSVLRTHGGVRDCACRGLFEASPTTRGRRKFRRQPERVLSNGEGRSILARGMMGCGRRP